MANSDEWEPVLQRALLDDQDAIDFCRVLFRISQGIDDIVDGEDLAEEDQYQLFWEALITLPGNPFYQQNFGELNAFMRTALNDWFDSNALHRGTQEERCAAYVLRDTLTNIVIVCARIVGGYGWMRHISEEIRATLYNESLRDFTKENA